MGKKNPAITDVIGKKLEYVAAVASFILFAAISLTDPGIKTEYNLYDTFMAIKPAPAERSDILLLNIDDPAIEEIGAWPWSRDIIADMIIRLREVNGARAAFDIEYLSPGQIGVNKGYVKTELPTVYSGIHGEVIDYISSFTEAVASRSIPLNQVSEVGGEMTTYIDGRMEDLSTSITSNIFRDNDEYFARALTFFGRAYLTINSERINTSEEAIPAEQYALNEIMLTNVVDPGKLVDKENAKTRELSQYEKGISPAIYTLLKAAKGAGFPNVYVDKDGVRRRIPLLVEHEGKYAAQLVFAPILDILTPDTLVRTGHSLILINALDPANPSSGVRKDIKLPLDENGRLLINWLKKRFSDVENPANGSFRSISVLALARADQLEERLIEHLSDIEGLGIRTASGYLPYHDAAVWLKASWNDIVAWKAALLEGSRQDIDEYVAAKEAFFVSYGEFLSGEYDGEIYETLERVAKTEGRGDLAEVSAKIRANFDVYREDFKTMQDHMAVLKRECGGSFCVIGYSGVGTSDLGVTPFQNLYPNVGTHANIYNTIMTGQFITPLTTLQSWAIALALAFLSALAFRRIKSLRGRILYGIGSSTLVFVSSAALFALFRVYVPSFTPLFTVLTTFLLVTIFRFVLSEQEKSFLRKAFTMYLSSDVVNQIVDDPSLLKLGGQEKQITALFTDIKSFSTLSEKVTPEHLVQILNRYLTVMSDIVLDQKGTIDKYIGDAIVSFFGAPIDLPDHAIRACMAAVRMKEAEVRLNEEMLASGETPMPIYTRIGVNTGAMVVGNMGTDNKMNYTIMGNDVNLAARLEGVNKQYGTWILVSESTWNATGGMFLGRKLDRVRVVGIDTPVQLYNVMGVRQEAKGPMIALADRFNLAIDAYRDKRFSDALILFTKCLDIAPDDDATKIFLDRVKTLIKEGTPAGWSDVINMTSK